MAFTLQIANAPRIETARLLLRLPQASDFHRYAELMTDPSAAQHIGGGMSRADAWRKFLQMPGAWMLQGFGMFSVIDRHSGLWLGQAGPWQPEGWPGTEIGYSFHPDAWGRGYATEACVAAIDWAFAQLGWDEVLHTIAPANTDSQKVAMRLGSRLRGPGKLPPPLDSHRVDLWGQTRAEWAARRGER
ncbi:MAG: N-acetyltransferase [Pseudoxanthomonas suwonensis]|nr:MAG: N-acetyltransferase [Pseudoxanthomonas suwonensis]